MRRADLRVGEFNRTINVFEAVLMVTKDLSKFANLNLKKTGFEFSLSICYPACYSWSSTACSSRG